MSLAPKDAESAGRKAWMSAALVCAALLIAPGLAWLLVAPRPTALVPSAAPVESFRPPEESSPRTTHVSARPVTDKPAGPGATMGGPVVGVVLDPDGKPVSKAFVGCDDRDKDLATSTDADGRFKLAPEAAGCFALVRHPDFVPAAQTELFAGRDNAIRLNRGGAIDGVVVTETGTPVARYLLAIESFVGSGESAEAPAPSPQALRIQDVKGAFLIESLAPGRYVLTVSAEARPPTSSGSIEVEVGRTTRHVRIVLPRGATLSGRITDAETHKPVGGALIAVDATTSTTANAIVGVRSDDTGAYSLEGVPPGPFSIRVAHDRHRTNIVPSLLTRGATVMHLDVELQPRGDGGPGDTETAGVGALLAAHQNGVLFSWVVPGSPAADAGLKIGDFLAKIDGLDAQNLTMAECAQRLRGAEGSRVLVSVLRNGAITELTLTRSLMGRP